MSAVWALQVLSYKVRGFLLGHTLRSLGRMVLATVVIMEVVWLVAQAVGSNDGFGAWLTVAVGGVVGIAVYLGVLALLQAPDLQQLRRAISRTKADSAPS